jgi:glyoxylase-like metal-dependent hydrolase (beta-lactamase superfamily II)
MNKTFKRTLLTLAILIAIVAITFGVVFLKLKAGIATLKPMETGMIFDDIFVVGDDYANMFIIQDSTQFIVIDCGNSFAVVADEMKKLGISPEDVTSVLLTHTDADHTGALELFSNAQLYMSKEEEQMINGTKSKFLWFGNSIPRTDYILLEDREIVWIGNVKVEGVLVPGHTTGMMAYLINDKYLFTGDILSLQDGKMAPIPKIFNMDTKQAISSMEIIRHIPNSEYIITSHWGFTDYKTAVCE